MRLSQEGIGCDLNGVRVAHGAKGQLHNANSRLGCLMRGLFRDKRMRMHEHHAFNDNYPHTRVSTDYSHLRRT